MGAVSPMARDRPDENAGQNAGKQAVYDHVRFAMLSHHKRKNPHELIVELLEPPRELHTITTGRISKARGY